MQNPERRHNFAALDGLRGVAAIAVLIAHSTSLILGHPLFERKYMAVQFFFMLSGFVVMCAYERRMKTGMTFAQFCLRRAIRLYPLIIVSTLMGWLYFDTFDAQFAASPDAIPAVMLSALALPIHETNFSFSKFPINPPVWSLFFELLAYGACGLFVRLASTRNLCIVAGAGLVLYAITDMQYGHDALPFRYHGYGIWASFTIGMLLWRAYQNNLLPRVSAPFPALAATMLLICAIPSSAPAAVNTVLVALAFPVMIAMGSSVEAPRLRGMLAFLGELSYPLYILHWPLLLGTQHFLIDRVAPAIVVAVACALSVACAWVIYIVFDRPFREYLNARFCMRPSIASIQTRHMS